MKSLLKEFVYIYASSTQFHKDKHFYLNILNAKLLWEFNDYNAKVAAFDLTGTKP